MDSALDAAGCLKFVGVILQRRGKLSILVDRRTGSNDLLPIIRRLGVEADLATLDGGDLCFSGNGPKGSILIGIERKKLRDILNCIDDARYAGVQQHEMAEMYQVRFLIVEGICRPSEEGDLMEISQGGWKPLYCKGKPMMYDKLFRYLLSVTLMGGTFVIHSASQFETAYKAVSIYHYFSKAWGNHTSQMAVHQLALPSLSKPTLERQFASLLSGIGVKHSQDVERHFKSIPAMVNAEERDWMGVPGIGPVTAKKIVGEIWKRK